MKIFICGPSRAGKDTVAEILGLKYTSSSLFCAPIVRQYLTHYSSDKECFEDRFNWRQIWFDAITNYNTPDRARLTREIFKTNDAYVGIRNREEYLASRHLADLSIFVYRDVPQVPSDEIKATDCDIVINNNKTLKELKECLYSLGKLMKLSM